MLDRTQHPEIRLAERVSLPETKTKILENGIKLMSLVAGTQDVMRLSIVFHAGTRRQAVPFAASAMLNMLSEGSEKYNSAEIAEILDSYGIFYDTNIDRDYTMITIGCLNKFLPVTLELLEQILLHPTFDPKELAIYASKRKQEIRIERDKPSFIAREEFSKALFGADHPYGLASDEEQYDSLTRDHLADHYNKFYSAQNCFAVASGMVMDEQMSQITEFLSKMQSRTTAADATVPTPHSIPQKSVQRNGATQSSIRIGKILFDKSHADYNAMQILSVVLGGYFGSRLVSNLREEKGYTYSIYSAMVTLQHSGYFAIATDVAKEHCGDAIREIVSEIERLRVELIDMEELNMVRNTIVGELMRLIDGPFGIADITIESEQCGKGNEMINEFLDQVKNITPNSLMLMAQKYLDPTTLTTVVVG